jgi:hypothetical protein
MNAVPLSSQNNAEFTASLPFSQHSLLVVPVFRTDDPSSQYSRRHKKANAEQQAAFQKTSEA